MGGIFYYVLIFTTYKYLKKQGYRPPGLLDPPRFAFFSFCFQLYKSKGDKKLKNSISQSIYVLHLCCHFVVRHTLNNMNKTSTANFASHYGIKKNK